MRLYECFLKRVETHHDSIAYTYLGETITYGRLKKDSDQLAEKILKRYNLKKQDPIGIYLHRGLQTPIALLACLKLEAYYIPIDITHPQSRVDSILEQTNPKIIISSDGNNFKIEEYNHTNQVDSVIKTDRLIYNIIFTSGTTGKPKGVIIPESAVLNRLQWMWETQPFATNDVLVCQKSFSLVAASWEYLGGLLAGIKTKILSREELLDSELLWKSLEESKASYLLASPPLLQNLVDISKDKNKTLEKLNYISSSTAPLSTQLARDVLKYFPSAKFYNLYGATECSSNALSYNCRKLDGESEVVPIGKAIKNTKTEVINGELCISGDCLALGYLDKYFGGLYKTGDMVKLDKNNNIILLGREDFRVNIRGFRVELGEIENILLNHAEVQLTVVMYFEKEGDLVAYIQSKNKIESTTLREYLLTKLPDYMVPNYFVMQDKLPLNNSGKIDREKLKKIAYKINMDSDAQSELEKKLEKMWCDILDFESISITSNFYELGGHSLSATQIINLYRKELGSDISIASFFENPCIQQQAKIIRPMDQTIIHPKNSLSGPLSNQQRAQWYLDQCRSNQQSYNISGCYCIIGKLDLIELENKIKKIIIAQPMLRAKIALSDTDLIQEIRTEWDFKLIIKNITDQTKSEFMIKQCNHNFDLEKGLLVHCAVGLLDTNKSILVYSMPHIICDGWSKGLFERSLSGQIEESKFNYLDYVDSAQKNINWSFWKKYLKDIPDYLALPTQVEREERQKYIGSRIFSNLDACKTKKIKNYCEKNQVSLPSFFLSAYMLMLSLQAEQHDFAVGMPYANRNEHRWEGMIGYFANMIPVRSEISPEFTFAEYIQTIQSRLFELAQYQHTPFNELILQLGIEQQQRYSSLVQAEFSMLEANWSNLNINGLVTKPELVINNAIQCDLTLFAREVENGMQFAWSYNTVLFNETRLNEIAKAFECTIIESLSYQDKTLHTYFQEHINSQRQEKQQQRNSSLSRIKRRPRN